MAQLWAAAHRAAAFQDRAAMFASRGYASFSLTYFGGYGLPEVYQDNEIEKFEEAVDYLVGRVFHNYSPAGQALRKFA